MDICKLSKLPVDSGGLQGSRLIVAGSRRRQKEKMKKMMLNK